MAMKTWFEVEGRFGERFHFETLEEAMEFRKLNVLMTPVWRGEVQRNWNGLPETWLTQVLTEVA